jgi:hypothetical protein
MTDKDKPLKLLLKNGKLVNVEDALIELEGLRETQESFPGEFQAMVALAQGRPQEAHPRHLKSLRRYGLIGRDGALWPLTADVLLSSLEMSPEGPVLVNPFKLSSQAEKLLAERADDDLGRRIRESALRGIRRARGRSEDEEGPSRR